ncbi:hypothetical protein TSST111916_12945 [Tsukamurella strandjordii]|uniref:hypothetical protein n=1 Tax=Tsukamurella TaxID=2060 RepID=UPI001C7D9EE2|nr:hypothetical protein [Tsukamurella sp. TY48]GIZ98499.1 hypothetical protein TTY48_31110 [Tsukamurella sp. TY48]
MIRELWDRRSELWARGNDGAPAHVWVARSAAFGLVAAAWSTWGGTVGQFVPQNPVVDFLLKNSTKALIALYLLYAARSKPRAVVAVLVIVASIIGGDIVTRLSTQWILTMMSAPDYSGGLASDPVYWFIQVSGGILNLVMIWAAWGIARRRSTAWVWSLPVPMLFTVLVPLWLQNNLEWVGETSNRVQLANLLVGVLPAVVSILAGWAADVAFGSAPPEQQVPIAAEPTVPEGMVAVPRSATDGVAEDPLFGAAPPDDPLFGPPDPADRG